MISPYTTFDNSSRLAPLFGQIINRLPELIGMIEFAQMGDLVGNHVAQHVIRRHHQTPAERQSPFLGATAPTGFGITH